MPLPTGADAADARHHVLAVSGGADSLALLHAVAANAGRLAVLGHRFHVMTVDHGLRPEAAEEAARVGRLASSLGLAHHIRRWDGERSAGNLQASARRARYGLLADAARQIGACSVLTAHHEDDQIETHLLAASRGAGSRGLSGMRPMRALRPGLWLLRPFLGVPGARLKATASAAGLPVSDDPSNRDPRYDRVRIRLGLAEAPLARPGLLADIAGHRLARDAADRALGACLHRLADDGALEVFGDGAVRLSAAAFAGLDHAVGIDLLARLVGAVGGLEYPPPRSRLVRLYAFLKDGEARGGARTLGGVAIRFGNRHLLHREFGRVGPAGLTIPADGGDLVYDGRLAIELASLPRPCLSAGARIVPLAALGLGNPRENSLPVLVDPSGRPIAAASMVLHKFPPSVLSLVLREEVSWRLWRDLG